MPDIRPSQNFWELVDTLKRVWDVRHNYVPIRIVTKGAAIRRRAARWRDGRQQR